MSKANVTCGNCSHEWEYSGASCSSCFCPRCGTKIRLDDSVRQNGHLVEVIDRFGFKNHTDT